MNTRSFAAAAMLAIVSAEPAAARARCPEFDTGGVASPPRVKADPSQWTCPQLDERIGFLQAVLLVGQPRLKALKAERRELRRAKEPDCDKIKALSIDIYKLDAQLDQARRLKKDLEKIEPKVCADRKRSG